MNWFFIGDRFPGEIAPGYSFSSIKGGLGALTTLPQQELWEIVAFIGLMEWGFGSIQKNMEEYCNDVMKGYKWNDATIRRKQEIELNNGRAAQMGILGLMVHEKLDGNPYIINSLLGSPVIFNKWFSPPNTLSSVNSYLICLIITNKVIK